MGCDWELLCHRLVIPGVSLLLLGVSAGSYATHLYQDDANRLVHIVVLAFVGVQALLLPCRRTFVPSTTWRGVIYGVYTTTLGGVAGTFWLLKYQGCWLATDKATLIRRQVVDASAVHYTIVASLALGACLGVGSLAAYSERVRRARSDNVAAEMARRRSHHRRQSTHRRAGKRLYDDDDANTYIDSDDELSLEI